MIRSLFLCAFLCAVCFLSMAARAEPVARLLPDQSAFVQNANTARLQLALSQGVPFRVFTVEAPPRLVVDIKGLDAQEGQGDAARHLKASGPVISDARFGTVQPGWSRFVADLRAPMLPDDVRMDVDEISGEAALSLTLLPVSATAFSTASGVPEAASWPQRLPAYRQPAGAAFVVVLDPGHGGIDPGAERDGLVEKSLVLEVAKQMQAILEKHPGIDVVLTRNQDQFVALQSRVALAHQVQADLFVSLHADALREGGAHGATIYTLSETASDTASAHLAARHDRSDIIAGLDLTGSDDEVTHVLLDLARRETEPRSHALALSFVAHMDDAGGPMNRRPLREAGFSVLKSADIPSILVEIGFLSSKRDRDNLRNPEWRATMSHAMAEAIIAWRELDRTHRALVRR